MPASVPSVLPPVSPAAKKLSVLCLAALVVHGVGPLAGPSAAYAQQPAAETPPAAADPVPPEQLSPRAVLRAFVTRMAKDNKQGAAELLDLSKLGPEAAEAKGPELAYKLFIVMQRTVRMTGPEEWPPLEDDQSFADVPAEEDAPSPWPLSNLGRYPEEGAEQIEIARDGKNRWRFSSATVAAIETLYTATDEKPVISQPVPDAATTEPLQVRYEKLWPKPLRAKYFLLPTYQWISLLLIGVAARLAELVSRTVMTAVTDRVLRRNDPDFEDSTAHVWRPVGRWVTALIWYEGALAIGLPVEVVSVMVVVLKLVTIVAAVVAVFAVIKLLAGYMTRRAKRTDRKFDDLIVPVAATALRVVTVVVAAVGAVATFIGTVPSALLGGLGIGGVAIALASQETLSNFFGSVTVLFDRPFEVGDWVLIEGVEGEVESVGFRSTRIRTGINSQVTLPNSKLAGASIDNWGRRRYRRYLTRLGVQYDTTPEQMEAFCEGIRELIRRQPHTRKDFYAAYFNDYGGSALEVLLVVFFEVPDWPTELRERHRLLSDILRLAARLGVQFAFPTQTVHLHRGEPPAGPPTLRDPELSGQSCAADIAGELLNYQDRPGKVKFPGPASAEEIAARQASLQNGAKA
ncbi:MAG: mechanosensitive ion channel family protein [Planctomycetota bacterium]